MPAAGVTFQPYVTKDANNIITDIMAKNVGNADAYLRVTIIPMYRNTSNGSLHWNAPVWGTDFTISYNSTDWIEDTNNHYFYYKNPVAIGATTNDLINSITVTGSVPKGCALYFDVLVSGLQATPENGKPIREVWGVTTDANGTITSIN